MVGVTGTDEFQPPTESLSSASDFQCT